MDGEIVDPKKLATRIAQVIGTRVAERGPEIARMSSTDSFGVGLAGGLAGCVVLFAALAAADGDESWLDSALAFTTRALSEPSALVGLHTGWSGLLVALRYLERSCGLSAPIPARVSLESKLCEAVLLECERFDPKTTDRYDLISGLAGTAVALGRNAPVRLVETLGAFALDRDAWFTLAPGEQTGPYVRNLGVAHGLPGLLSALCQSTLSTELRASKASIIDFLLDCSGPERPRTWGYMIDSSGVTTPVRPTWCYGTSGVAAVLALAAHHLEDSALLSEATEALRAVADRGPASWKIDDKAICHGESGIALCLRSAQASPTVDVQIEAATRRIAAAFDPNLTFGYQSYRLEEFQDVWNLLEGASGVALSLLTLNDLCDESWTTWMLAIPGRHSNMS